MGIEIRLNTAIPDNYVFFCSITGIHLSRMTPVGYPRIISSSILRGLRAKTLIDVKGVVDIQTGKLKEVEQPQVVVEAEPVVSGVVEEEVEVKDKKTRKK